MDVRERSHHLPRIRAAQTYIAALTLPALDRLLLGQVAEARLARRNWTPSEARWGAIVHRRRETISRAVNRLAQGGWLRLVRRGRRLTNIYLLARWFWRRLTGAPPRRWDPELQGVLFRLGTRSRVPEHVMARLGIRAPAAEGPAAS